MAFLTYSWEADGDRCGLANMFKHLGLAVASDIVSHLKVAERTCNMEQRQLDKSIFGSHFLITFSFK